MRPTRRRKIVPFVDLFNKDIQLTCIIEEVKQIGSSERQYRTSMSMPVGSSFCERCPKRILFLSDSSTFKMTIFHYLSIFYVDKSIN